MFFAGSLSLKEAWVWRSHSKAEVLSPGLVEVRIKSKLTLKKCYLHIQEEFLKNDHAAHLYMTKLHRDHEYQALMVYFVL